MSISQKNIQNISKLLEGRNIIFEKPLKRKESTGESHNSLSLKYSLYESEEKKIEAVHRTKGLTKFLTKNRMRLKRCRPAV